MVSIYLLNKLLQSLVPNTFIGVITNTDIIVGGFSKLYIEHTLLKTEMSIYTFIF